MDNKNQAMQKEEQECYKESKRFFLGSDFFWNALQELIDTRKIKSVVESNGDNVICLDASRDKYSCELDEDTAFLIATEIDFPLSNYLV